MTPSNSPLLHRASLCLGLLLCAPAAAAQTPDDFPERLELLKQRLEAARTEAHVPGIGFALVNRDGILWSGGFGVTDTGSNDAVDDRTLFAIGSTTKSFTAALAGSYIEQDRFDWDTPASELLPAWQLKGAGDQAITMRDLLSHRTGYPRMGLLFITGKADSDRILEVANNAKPLHGYQELFLYNNIQYLAAGEATSAVGDAEWEHLLETRLTDRLGMVSTTGAFDRVVHDRRTAQGYKWDYDESALETMQARNISNCAPAGSLYSNARDMARWMQFQLNRGQWNGQQLLAAGTIEECWEPNINIGPGVDYGMGWMIQEFQGQRMIEHGGNIDGYSASIGMLPESGYAYVMLCNLDSARIQQQVPGIVFDTLLSPLPSDSDDREDYSPYLGEYIADFGQWDDQTFTVLDKDGVLAVDIPGQMVFELNDPNEDGRRNFKLTDTIQISFVQDSGGQVTLMRLHQGGLDMEFPRKGVEIPIEIPLPQLKQYLGKYAFDEANHTWTVLIKNNRLAVDVPGEMVYELKVPDSDGWRAFRVKEDLKLQFDQAETGEISQMRFINDGKEYTLPREAAAAEEEGISLAEVFAAMRLGQRQAQVDSWQGYTLACDMVVEQSGIVGSQIFASSADGRYHVDVSFGDFGQAESALMPDGGWVLSDFEPYDEFSAAEYQEALEGSAYPLVLGDLRRHYDELYLDGDAMHGGQKYWKLAGKHGDRPITTFYVNQETGLIDRFDYVVVFAGGSGSITIQADLSDYRMIQGVQVPFLVTIVNQASGRVIQKITEFNPGQAPDEGSFDTPKDR